MTTPTPSGPAAGGTGFAPAGGQRVGYLVPEFPGQTHSFFWREITALRKLGIEPRLISTRRPPQEIISHSWAAEAIAATTYLIPARGKDLVDSFGQLVRATPAGWARCLRSVGRAEGLGAKGGARLLGLVVMGARVAALARLEGWTHLHVHFCADAAHVALFAHLLSGLPYSITLHSALRDNGPNQKEKWRHVAFGITVNQALVPELEQGLGGRLPALMGIAPMGVEVARFTRNAPYRPWRPEDGPGVVFSCGRLNAAKGHGEVVRALALLLQRGLDLRLVIAGEEHHALYRQELEALIYGLGLRAHVQLLGAVSEERVRQELERAHVFVLASHGEALGVATMEAMSMEVPVVATRVGGVPELVGDGEEGTLVPPRDPEAVAGALERLLRDPERASAMASSARRKVEARFHSGRSAEVLVGLLAQVRDAPHAY